MIHFFKKYNLEDLKSLQSLGKVDRSAIQVAVIDDKTFPPLEELRRHQFNISHFTDIERLNILSEFDIVVTDIKDVGKLFGSRLGGAHLIEEISKHFPNKYLIAYSASRFDMSLNKYFSMCDEQKRKDTDVHDWVTLLDLAITRLNDPIYQWEKTRRILVKQQVSSRNILKLERAFSKSLLTKNNTHILKIISSNSNFTDKPLLKIAVESISSFTANLISELIKSG